VALQGSCRIYRDPPNRGDVASAGASGQAATAAGEASVAEREATKPSAPAADALNLWVLSRPQGDLPTAEAPAPSAAPAETPSAPIVVAAVLGVGPAPACAEAIARRAADSLASDRAPLEVLASALDSARRWRWPQATGTLSATLKSSTEAFGGVQSAPASAFGVSLLLAVEQRAILGGPGSRWPRAPSGTASEPPACEANIDASVTGPVGMLLRTRDGQFFGGILQTDPLPDAGVISIAAQYGVSLAVGVAGAVLMAADCEPPPLDRVAEAVYASRNWVLATADRTAPGACRLGYALLDRERAWVAPASGLAAAIVEAAAALPVSGAPRAPAPPLERAAPDVALDAGVRDGAVTP